MMNLLVVKPDKLGDFILAVPAIKLLREQLPHTNITLAVGPEVAEIATWLPMDIKVKVGQRRGKRLVFNPGVLGWHDAGILLRYDADYYGAAEILAEHCEMRFSWEREVTPTKIARNPPGWETFFTLLRRKDDHVKHEVIRNLELAQFALGAGVVDERTPLWLPTRREWNDLPSFQLVVVPGAGEPKKMLTPDQWAFVGLRDWDVLWLGAPSELGLLEACGERCGGSVYAGDLRTACGLVHNAQHVVTMDSGLGHVAAAYGKKQLVVNVVGPVPEESPYSPKRFGPWNEKALVAPPAFLTSPDFVQWMED